MSDIPHLVGGAGGTMTHRKHSSGHHRGPSHPSQSSPKLTTPSCSKKRGHTFAAPETTARNRKVRVGKNTKVGTAIRLEKFLALHRRRAAAALLGLLLILTASFFRRGDLLHPASIASTADGTLKRTTRTRSREGADDHHHPPPKGPIPRTLWFTHRDNILETKSPRNLYDNVMRTIDIYRDAWLESSGNDAAGAGTGPGPGPGPAPVRFVTDDECASFISEAEPRLLPHFLGEKQGMYKADVCRVAALYLHGGYYMDVDMEVVEPLVLDDSSSPSFVTVVDAQGIGFFQSFLASVPRHPILAEALRRMLSYYDDMSSRGRVPFLSRIDPAWMMGTVTLKDAHDSLNPRERGDVLLLQELNLTPIWLIDQIGIDMIGTMEGTYPEVPRRHGPNLKCCCNFVVHDPQEGRVYFYSRIVGSHAC